MGSPGTKVRLIGLVVSLIALSAVVLWASKQDAPTLPSSAGQIGALVGAIGIYGVATLLRGERWWRLLEDSRAQASRADAYALTAVGYMGNNVLPARGGDAMRVVLGTSRSRARTREVIGTLVAERVLDVVFLLSLFAVLAYAVLRGIQTPDISSLLVVAVVAAAIAGITVLVLRVGSHRLLVERVKGFLAPMVLSTRRLRGRHAVFMVAQTAAIWGAEALTYLAVAHSVGVDMDLLEACYLIAVSSIFLLIPSGPGYVGTLDAALLFGLGAIGTDGSDAVSYLLMARFVVFVPVTIAGLILLVLRYRRLPRDRGAVTSP